MCDEQTQQDVDEYHRKNGELSRREFGKVAIAASLAAIFPPLANALDTVESSVDITTPHGIADCYFVHPAEGEYPGILIWPDILGLRPAFKAMGKRLAQYGYAVLVVNPFYRNAKAPVVPEGSTFGDPTIRDIVLPLARQLNEETAFADAKAFVGFLDAQASVDTRRKIGTAGYCMGGPLIMRTAAAVPERIGAAASFHGGGLVTDKPDSPHLLIPRTSAQVLHAIAANDDQKNPDVKHQLRQAYAAADIAAEIEVYEDTLHGWCPPDSAVYNEAQAERAWARLLDLFDRALV
jgi:carboxymethylenebutenolidase